MAACLAPFTTLGPVTGRSTPLDSGGSPHLCPTPQQDFYVNPANFHLRAFPESARNSAPTKWSHHRAHVAAMNLFLKNVRPSDLEVEILRRRALMETTEFRCQTSEDFCATTVSVAVADNEPRWQPLLLQNDLDNGHLEGHASNKPRKHHLPFLASIQTMFLVILSLVNRVWGGDLFAFMYMCECDHPNGL